MNKVYIVTAGKYSEYHIVGATLDRKQAELACEVYGWRDAGGDPIGVEEYDLDIFDGIKGNDHIYRVSFDRDGWEVKEEKDCYYLNPINATYEEDMNWGTYSVTVVAKDEAHALKIAQDKRAEYLARKEGIT